MRFGRGQASLRYYRLGRDSPQAWYLDPRDAIPEVVVGGTAYGAINPGKDVDAIQRRVERLEGLHLKP